MRRWIRDLRVGAGILLLGALSSVALAGGSLTQTDVDCQTGQITGAGNCTPSECDARIFVIGNCGGGDFQVCHGRGGQYSAKVECKAETTAGCCFTFVLYCCDAFVEEVTVCCP